MITHVAALVLVLRHGIYRTDRMALRSPRPTEA